MSHEIRTPLNGVLGLSSLLESENLPGETRAQVQAIRSAGLLLQRVLNDVLDYAKLEAGRLEMESVPFDPRRNVEDAAGLFRAAAAQKGLELSVIVDPMLPPLVTGDPSRLQQVLMNLLNNAIKFTECGSVKLELVYEDRLGATGCLSIRVRDTGIGIPPHRRERLFQPFTQLDSSTSRRYGGTGLGLAISHRIVQQMGGAIEVDSLENRGTTFCVRVPAERAAVAPPFQTHQAPALPRGLKVLVVEDNRVNQMVAVRMLERLGIQPDLAADGEEAVRLAERRPYDLVFMDVQMPGTDGLEATRRIRQRIGTQLPIVALTAHASREDAALCRTAGMDDYLTKPLTTEALRNAFERWVLPEQVR
jgi:CheY-like chemotaxis protein